MFLIGEMGGVKVFATEGACCLGGGVVFLPDIPSDVHEPKRLIMTVKHDSLARFIHIVYELCRLYELPRSALHIFFDATGDLIAFNRNGSLFLRNKCMSFCVFLK